MEKIKVLVTAVGAPPGRNVVRSLGKRKDIGVVAADADPLTPVLYNRDEVEASYILPFADRTDEYIQTLKSIVIKENISVVIPCIEEEILVLSSRKEFFSELSVTILCPGYGEVKNLTDTYDLMKVARSVNVPAPEYCLLNDFAESQGALGYPLIVKPRIGHGARKIAIANNAVEMDKVLSRLSGVAGEFLVQSYIPGGTGSIFLCGLLYGKESCVIAEFMSRSIKTLYEFGGPAVCGEPIKGFDRLKEYSKSLIDAIGGWYGPVNIEYKVSSEDGIPYILEVNPRFWGYGLLAVESGVDFPYIAVMDAVGRQVIYQGDYSDDVVLMREVKDTVIPKTQIKRQPFDKVIYIYELREVNEGILDNIDVILKNGKINGLVLTGAKESIDEVKKYRKSKDRLSFYTMQADTREENLREIAIYNSADVVICLDSSDKIERIFCAKDLCAYREK